MGLTTVALSPYSKGGATAGADDEEAGGAGLRGDAGVAGAGGRPICSRNLISMLIMRSSMLTGLVIAM